MIDRPKCRRCGDVAETHEWERSSTFWGWFALGTRTVTHRLVRVKSQYFRREGYGSPLLLSDELQPLCQECWGALVGEFMQGRAVAGIDRGGSLVTRSRTSARQAGTTFETLIAGSLAAYLNDDRIERRTRTGSRDKGDIAGLKTLNGRRIVLECKDYGGRILAAEWVREAAVEATNDGAAVGAVAVKRRGTRVGGDQFILMTVADFAALLGAS